MAKDKVDTLKNILGALMNGYKDDHYNNVEVVPKRISTGSLKFDQRVRITSGSVVRFVGPTSAGKTSEAFLLGHNFMAAFPQNSRGIYVKAEARLGEDLKNRTGHKFVYKTEGWEIGTVS